MKRIVGGKTYNTDKSVLVAQREYDWEDHAAVVWQGVEALYQGRTGAFFLVVIDTAIDFSESRCAGGDQELPRATTKVVPLTLEQAMMFGSGNEIMLGRGNYGGDSIEIVRSGILPEPEEV